MTFEQIINDLKNRKFKPVYYLTGEEPFYIDKISNYIAANVLSDSEKDFNQSVFYGKDVDVSSIIMAAKRFPMMSEYQVIIIKEAQNIRGIDGKSSGEEIVKQKDQKKKAIDPFLGYMQNPPKSTILVINLKYRTLDKRTQFCKAIEENGVFFESKKLYENQIPAWIEKYFEKENIKIDNRASILLTEYLGTDLEKIENELNKLIIAVQDKSKGITLDHIEEFIGISKEYNVYELQKAIGQKNILKANQIINYFAENPKENPIFTVTSSLYLYFTKLIKYQQLKDKSRTNVANVLGINPYFVPEYEQAQKRYSMNKLKEIISYLCECDAQSKGVESNANGEELIKELIFKIIH